MPVQKRSKGSSKSKKTIRRRTMRGGYLSDANLIKYFKSKGISEEDGYDFTNLDDETAKEMFNFVQADYEKWLKYQNLNAHPITTNDEEAEEALPPAAEAAEEAAPANGAPVDILDQIQETAPNVEQGTFKDKVDNIIEDFIKNISQQDVSGGKKLYKSKGGAFEVFENPTDINFKQDIETIPNRGVILRSNIPEFKHIINFIITKKLLKNPEHKYINQRAFSEGQELSALLKNEDKSMALKALLYYSGNISNMIKVLDAHKNNEIERFLILNTYSVLTDVVKTGNTQSEFDISNLVEGTDAQDVSPLIPTKQGLFGKLFGSKGGFLDTTRIYNAQGLLSDAVDPLTAASTAGDEVDRVPLPFSSRGSGSITYESDINQDFIADLLPSLGKSGGAKKSKKTRK